MSSQVWKCGACSRTADFPPVAGASCPTCGNKATYFVDDYQTEQKSKKKQSNVSKGQGSCMIILMAMVSLLSLITIILFNINIT